ncbi:hypothetical protein MASR1M32_03400 [Rhodobacter sp.]
MPGAARFRLGHQIKAEIALDHGADLCLGDADQNDRLGMLDQFQSDDPGALVNRNQCMDRLAGIAGGADEIRSDEGPSDGFSAFQHRSHRQIGAGRAKGIGADNQIGGALLGQQFFQHGLCVRLPGQQQEKGH